MERGRDRHIRHQQRQHSSSDYSTERERSHDLTLLESANPPRENSPNVLLDYTKYSHNEFVAIRFIFECGTKLEAQPMTISTAAILLHRFRAESSNEKSYDIYLMAGACLYLAGKIESQLLKIRDVINVTRVTLHRNSTPLELGEAYWASRESIVQAELLLIRILKFNLTVEHPQKFLVHYLRSLEELIGSEEWTKIPVPRTAWAMVQDFHHDSSIISYPPQVIAIAAIELSLSAFGCTVPLCAPEGTNSWQTIFFSKFNKFQHTDVMTKMLNLYDLELSILRDALFTGNSKDPK